jgi:tellurite resistance-related uncharacterized protein
VERSITGYHLDDHGDWVASLACGHSQHVRHRPPFQVRDWVQHAAERERRLGTPLDCPLCDRAELPAGLTLIRTSPLWDEHTMPDGLRRSHHLARGVWGRICVRRGRLHFVAATVPALDAVIGAEATQAIPPEVEHEVRPLGPVAFSLDFLAVGGSERPADSIGGQGSDRAHVGSRLEDEGGDAACWAHLLCPHCGAVVTDGYHFEGCPAGNQP